MNDEYRREIRILASAYSDVLHKEVIDAYITLCYHSIIDKEEMIYKLDEAYDIACIDKLLE